MPSSTKKQHNFMAAIAHNPSFAKKVGIPQSVGKDFNEADKGRKFGRGGKINIQDTQHGKLDMPFKQLNRMAGKKGGGSVKKYAKGAIVSEKDYKASGYSTLRDYLNNQRKLTRRGETDEQNEAIQSEALGRRQIANMARMPKVTDPGGGENLPQDEMRTSGAKKGGLMKESKAMVGKEMMFMKKKGAPASMMKHEKAEMNMGGMSKYAKGGGIESRGKTKGTMIRMATGGSVGSASRRADGIAQRGKTRC